MKTLRDGSLAIGYPNGSIGIWNVENSQLLRTLIGHTDQVNCIKQLPNGNLASASNDKKIKIWNPLNAELIRTLDSHTNAVKSLELLANEQLLASSSLDQTILVWNTTTLELFKTVVINQNVYTLIAFTGAGGASILAAEVSTNEIRALDIGAEIVVWESKEDRYYYIFICVEK